MCSHTFLNFSVEESNLTYTLHLTSQHPMEDEMLSFRAANPACLMLYKSKQRYSVVWLVSQYMLLT